MNLLCAEGLPGAEDLKIDDTLATLDAWTQHVKSETDRNFHHFQENPKDFNNSEGYFRALLLITVVQQDFNIHYNPAHITTPDSPEPDDTFFVDSKDLFLHGLVSSRAMGTCISMPVFYVALGQRLGYAPSCCKVVQWIQDKATRNGQLPPVGGNPPRDGNLHIDNNLYISDDVTDPATGMAGYDTSSEDDIFTYSDTPTRNANNGDVLAGDKRFRIVIYDSCNGFKKVASTQFGIYTHGTWPNVDYGVE